MNARLLLFWEGVRSSYWFIPALMLVGSALLAFLLTAADQRVRGDDLTGYGWIFAGGIDGARSVLSVIAGSVIGVAGTTFSITIAVLSLASSQFGPRLLRGFMRDSGNQIVLGTFLSTFLYCLLVLRTIRSVDETPFVPHIAVTAGVALAVACTCLLIYFIHHVSVSIQAGRVVGVVATELDEAIRRLFPEEIGGPATESPAGEVTPAPDGEEAAGPVRARSAGYVQTVDGDALLSLAARRGGVVRLLARPGHFVPAGAPLALLHPAPEPGDDAQTAGGAVRDAIVLGEQRTPTQDAEFLFQQIVEVAVRALSPGINDPFTAVVCLDRLGAALCDLCGRRFPDPRRYDDGGTLRVVAEPARFADLLALALGQIRHYGRSDPLIALRLQRVVGQIAACARTEEQRSALREEARRTREETAAAADSPEVRRQIEAAHQETMAALAPARGG